MSVHVEDTILTLRALLRFPAVYVPGVREALEDLATREIADTLKNDAHLRRVHGEPALVAKIEALEAELETARAQAEHLRPLPRLVHGKSVDRTPPAASRVESPQVAASAAEPDTPRCRKAGHPLTPDNLRVTKTGARVCKACVRLYMHQYWKRRKVAPA